MSGDHNMYQAWREFEAYAEPVTEAGVKSMQRRHNQFKAGWEAAINNVTNLLEIQHEAANGKHNYFLVAANLIKAEYGSEYGTQV